MMLHAVWKNTFKCSFKCWHNGNSLHLATLVKSFQRLGQGALLKKIPKPNLKSIVWEWSLKLFVIRRNPRAISCCLSIFCEWFPSALSVEAEWLTSNPETHGLCQSWHDECQLGRFACAGWRLPCCFYSLKDELKIKDLN